MIVILEDSGNPLRKILRKLEAIMATLDRITAATERTEGVSLSIRTHLEALGAYVRENIGNAEKLNELADKLENQAASEEATILANPLPGTVVPPQ